MSTFLGKFNERWSDGREHVAGDDVTAADFNLLAFYTSIVTNPGIHNPQVGVQLKEKIESLPNAKRIIDNISRPL